ncbi:MAG: DUF4236 domain-containing protein [Marinospirillum sp.]|uniref:DUF4236 domain-containing protein n=1 Tax=Marinospirillum sp. TaxID=2183934 RepID=UPI001A0FDF2F|nr:DUF4236 domain-containing protein [Marinospirillum sp.]MBE0509066.1 DUF4236 domain-containing protein [Marinospirillum sp.]
MAFRFRNTIRIAPGIRLNLGKTGISLSAGVRGATVTAGKRGVHGNVGLPGTGLSYRTRLDKSPAHRRRVEQQEKRQYRQDRQQQLQQNNPDLGQVTLSLDDKGQLLMVDASGQPLETALRRRLQKDFEADIREWLEVRMEAINGDIDLLLNPHLDTLSPDSSPPEYQIRPFTELQPAKPQLQQPAPQPVKPEPPRIGWLDRLIPGRKQRLMDAWQDAQTNWSVCLQRWEEDKQRLDEQQAHTILQYEKELAEWRQRKEIHNSQQREEDSSFSQRLLTDSELMAEVLQAELEALDWPRETLIDFDLDEAGQRLQLDVDLPEIEDFPQQEARLGARELRLVLKQKSQTQLRHEYARHVHGVLLRVIGTAFATLPSIQQLIISGYSQRLNPATGHVEDEYLISAKVERTAFEQINFNNLEEVDPIMAMERFELAREMSKSYLFTSIKPFDPASPQG